MRILTRVTASGGMDISSAGTDTITLGNSTVDKIIANAPITASAGITGSIGSFNILIVDGVQITGSTGAGNLVTSGSVTGSGTQENPIDLKSNVIITTLTASTGIASGRGDFSSLFVNGNAVSTGSAGGLSSVETSGSITGSGIIGNEIRLKDQINVNSITASFFVGDGHQIGNLSASNIINFTNDVRNQFSAGTNITINNGVISSSVDNLTASNITNFTNDVRGQFSAGTNIVINNGVISSSGGSVTSGNITGSGTEINPIDLKSNVSILILTASTGIASGRGDFNNLFVNGNAVSTGSGGGTTYTAGLGINLDGDIITNTGVLSVTGTTNQILVNAGTSGVTGSVTLTLPQSIATTSSPTFANTTATTGYRLDTSNVYGIDTINISSPVVIRGVRLVSSSLAGVANLSGDYVTIGTIGSTSGIFLSSSANIINSSPNFAISGTFNASNANFYGTLIATGSSQYVILQPNTQFTASAPVMVYGNQATTSLNYINGQNIFINGTTNYIGVPFYAPVDSRTTIESDNIDLSGSVNVTGTLYVNGVQITGSGGSGGGSTAYDIAGIYNGKPLASETIFRFIAVRSYDFSTTGADHYFYSFVTSSVSKTFNLYNNATLIGSVSFSANSAIGSVSISSASFVAGEIFSVLAPSSQDTTLSDLYFTFKADTV